MSSDSNKLKKIPYRSHFTRRTKCLLYFLFSCL